MLGYTDLLIISKKSTFTFFPSVMMAARDKPVCTFMSARSQSSFTCYAPSTGQRSNLAAAPRDTTGLAPVARKKK